jgi:hypothetical protein
MITIPVGRLNAILGGIAALAIWGFASIIMMVAGTFQAAPAGGENAVASVGKIVTEAGEGSTKVTEVQPASDKTASPSTNVTKSDPVSDDHVYDYDKVMAANIDRIRAEDTSRKLEEDLNMLNSVPAITELPAVAKSANQAIRVEGFTLNPKSDELQVGFNIVNRGNGRARGRVYGIAEFAAADGKRYLLTSHQDIDPVKLSSNKKIGTMFSARRLTKKDLTFEAPDGKKGIFTTLRVVVNEDTHSEPITMTKSLR